MRWIELDLDQDQEKIMVSGQEVKGGKGRRGFEPAALFERERKIEKRKKEGKKKKNGGKL